jgi:hypothetical protein
MEGQNAKVMLEWFGIWDVGFGTWDVRRGIWDLGWGNNIGFDDDSPISLQESSQLPLPEWRD